MKNPFDDKFFKKHQKIILEFINYYGGKDVLGIKDEDLVLKVTPESYHILKNVYKNKLELQAKFYTGNNIAKMLYPFLSGFIQKGDFYARHLYNSSVIGVDTGSARVLNQNQTNWATARAAASGTLAANDQSWDVRSDPTASASFIDRTFCPYLTASLGATATVTAATVDLYRLDSFTGGMVNTDSQSIVLVTQTQASTSTLVTSDFSQIAAVSKGSLAFSSTTNSQYNSITVTDLTIISTTAISKIGARASGDQTNSAPTGNNMIGGSGANPPTLTVTYTLPAVGGDTSYNFFM